MRSHGKTFGFVPYDSQVPRLERTHERLCNAGDECFLAPVIFGAGYTANPKSALRHPFQTFLQALILWWWRAGRGG